MPRVSPSKPGSVPHQPVPPKPSETLKKINSLSPEGLSVPSLFHDCVAVRKRHFHCFSWGRQSAEQCQQRAVPGLLCGALESGWKSLLRSSSVSLHPAQHSTTNPVPECCCSSGFHAGEIPSCCSGACGVLLCLDSFCLFWVFYKYLP